MMLLFAPHPHSAEKFSAPIAGLRSLLAAPAVARGSREGSGCVVTRASVAAAHGCGCAGHREDGAKERRDDAGRHGEGEGVVVVTAKEEDENGIMEDRARAEEQEEEEDEELDGFWVSYGRRRPRRRRLPPPIPSLVARGALRRTRTDDGRLVIRIVPVVVRPECVRARRRRERLVEHYEDGDDSPMAPPPATAVREQLTAAAREDGIVVVGERGRAGVVEDVAVAAKPAETTITTRTTMPVMVPPPTRVRSVGCFEEVFKLGGSMGSSSLHQMQMPSLRMVH